MFNKELETTLQLAETDKKYLSDIITVSDIDLWNNKELIVIQAQTGVGKSTFIKETLYQIAKLYNKKILYLVNREKLKLEFQKEIETDNKGDVITIKTYQSLEPNKFNTCDKARIGVNNDLSMYDYIICDESHYFHNDSLFNKYTQESFNSVIDTNSIKIFMSATNDSLINYLDYFNFDYKLYETEQDYSYANITFFSKKLYIYDLMRNLKAENEKCIIFMQDIVLAYELYDSFKQDSLFLCSKSNKEYYQYVDTKAIDNMLENKKFDNLFLITTTVFENGNNIKDDDLHHMIIQLNDLASIKQCIGRKRIECSTDYLNIAICDLNNQRISGLLQTAKNVVKPADLLIEQGEKAYCDRYGYSHCQCVYDIYNNEQKRVEKRVNSFRYFKLKENIRLYEMWLKDIDKMGFKKSVIQMFGKEWEGIYSFNCDSMKGRISIEEYITPLIDIALDKEQQQALIKKINLRDNRNRLIKGIGLLNMYIQEELHLLYEIKTQRKQINGKRTVFWIICRV